MYILQDSKGYMWFSTDAGVSRFDGYRFRNFTKKDGLPDNEIHTMYEDREGRIWFIGMKWELSYFLSDSIYLFNPNNVLEGLHANGIFQDREGVIWFYFNKGGVFRFFNGKIERYNDMVQNLPDERLGFIQDHTGRFVISTNHKYGFLQNGNIVWHPMPDSLGLMSGLVKFFVLKSGEVLALTRTYIFSIRESEINVIFPSKNYTDNHSLNMLQEDHQGNLLLATNLGVFQLTKAVSDYVVTNTYLHSRSVNMAFEDHENNLWYSTRDDGVYFLSSNAKKVNNIGVNEGLKDNTIYDVVKLSDGTLCMGSQNGLLQFYNKNKFQFLNLGKHDVIANVNDLYVDSNRMIWCGVDGGFFIIPEDEITAFKTVRWRNTIPANKTNSKLPQIKVPQQYNYIIGSSVKTIAPGRNSDLWIAKSTGLFKVERDLRTNSDYVITTYSNSRTSDVSVADDGKVWYCNPSGLSYLLNDSTSSSGKFVLPDANISDIEFDGNGVLWIATNGSGIYLYKDTVISSITAMNGLSSDIVNSLLIDVNSVWASTAKGLSKIVCNDSSYLTFNILRLGKEDGLPSEEINSVYVDDDTVYAATKKGLAVFNQSEISADNFPPPVYIESIEINGRDTAFQNGLSLRHFQNDISFLVLGISYKNSGKLRYMYKLIGAEEEWKISETREINYQLLPPGNYKFVAKAVNDNGIESLQPAEISFIIQPPFWQTLWFRVLMLLIFVLTMSGMIWSVVQYYRNKNKLMNRIFESEQKALRAQMNPHFVFNALYSIQNFITKNDQYSANLYLAKFSDLVRMTLDYSRNISIPVAEEIRFLKTYLELESLRFENKFDYKIEVDSSVHVYKMKILSMLIQPFVENSIKHGLLPKKTKGVLRISLSKENGFLLCTIEDNGIGREQASEFQKAKTSGHKSQGIAITVERLELIRNGEKKGSIAFVDIKDHDGKAIGTKAIIKIPYLDNSTNNTL